MAIPIFSNKPKFCTQQLSFQGILNLTKFNAMTQSSLENPGVTAFANACGDPNLATTFRKNIIHKLIRCGGKPIDLNFMEDLFPQQETLVDTKNFYNHYICDTDMNIYAAATATAATPGGVVVWQLLKNNHTSSGTTSYPNSGFSVWDKDNQIEYIVDHVDTTTPYAHKVYMYPTDGTVTGTVKANTPYLVIPGRRVGGNSCKEVTSTASTIGYSQQLAFLRVRRDWEVEIDLLRGYLDKIQYAVIYDKDGNPQDSWEVFEAKEAREGVRMALNIPMFIGSPTTNAALITGGGAAVMDATHTGFYGLIPSIKYGNGVVYNFRSSVGFDLESDGEPIFLWQDSQKRTSKFLVLHGLGFKFALNNRSNKLVARAGNNLTWEGYRRIGALSTETWETEMAKLGIKGYDYEGFGLDFKKIGAFSDKRYVGSPYYSNIGIMLPQDGPTEEGRQISPIEMFQEGQNGWTGGYFESYVDNRFQTEACETIQGYSAQSLSMAVHCPDLMALLNPITEA